jgi:hypothetical protein
LIFLSFHHHERILIMELDEYEFKKIVLELERVGEIEKELHRH